MPQGQDIFDTSELREGLFYLHLLAQFLITFLSCASILAIDPLISRGATIFTSILLYCLPVDDFRCSGTVPSVTLGLLVARKITLVAAILSMVIQLLGAISGFWLLKLFSQVKVDIYNHMPQPAGWVVLVALAHFIMATFTLTLQLLNTNDPTTRKILRVASFIAKTDLNTAVSLAVAILHKDQESCNSPGILCFGTFPGAIAAAVYHKHLKRDAPEVPEETFHVAQRNAEESTGGGGEVDDVELQDPNARESSGREVEEFYG